MSRYQLTKIFCNPLRIRDAKFFGHRKRRRPKAVNEPGDEIRMKTLPSANDGRMAQVLATRTRDAKPDPKSAQYGKTAIVLSFVALLSLGVAILTESRFAGMVSALSFFTMHWCTIISRSLSRGTNRDGFLALACFYGMVLVWILVRALI